MLIITGTEPECDPDALFRTISGQCNNLEDGKTLWGSMTIQMRRESDDKGNSLHGIDNLYQIGTYNDLLNTTTERQDTGM